MTDKSKFETEGFSVEITGKHIQISKAMETYVLEKISKIQRFTNNILDITVTLEVQKISHSVAIVMKFLHFRIQAHSTTVDLYAAIDGAFNKIYRLIRKYKEKLKNHRNTNLSTIDMSVHVFDKIDDLEDINDEIEEENLKEELAQYSIPEIVAKETMAIKMLTQAEAIMKLELAGESFLIYKSEEDQKLKVLYKRLDEKLGLVEVEGK